MSSAVLQQLPSAVADLRRTLERHADGHLSERIAREDGGAWALPAGGVFAAWTVEDGVLDLGAPLARTLAELAPPPVARLAWTLRVLQDLETLHATGCTHGALHAEGWGAVEGRLVVRPAPHVPPTGAPTSGRFIDAASVSARRE